MRNFRSYYEELYEMLENNLIIKARYNPSFPQVNTKKGKYLMTITQLMILKDENIPIYSGKTLIETYNKICR